MERRVGKIAFVLEEFGVPSPGQQLLDRFLIGYPREGGFHRPDDCQIIACLAPGANDAELKRRVEDFDLTVMPSPEKAAAEADAVLTVSRSAGTAPNDARLRSLLTEAKPGTPFFVYGRLAANQGAAQSLLDLAASRDIALSAGTPLGLSWRLPQIDLPLETPLAEALVLVQGPSPAAEFDGLECLVPIIERRRGGEAGVRRIRRVAGPDVWRAGEEREWSWPLLAAAISRSDAPLGESERDGRVQDLVGMGLVPVQARTPRALLLEHGDSLRTAVLVLDGVVGDYNFAFRGLDGRILSAQIYRAPYLSQQEFSLLAQALEGFFRNRQPPWPVERGEFIAGLLSAAFASSGADTGWVETPQLKRGYRLPG